MNDRTIKNRTLTTDEALRYSRQIFLSGFDLDKQEVLINSRILMMGAGGLGCAASQYLVSAGIGALTIVDDDIVELSNLQRQVLHTQNSIGEQKVLSAQRALAGLNHLVEINTLDTRPNAEALNALVLAHDLVLDCTDNLLSRNLINDVCYQNNKPLVSGAAIRMEGQIFCVIPEQKTACYRCISQFFGEQNLSCVESGVMSPLVGIIGATQALEAIKILTKYGETAVNKLQIFDAMNAQWTSFAVTPLPGCKACSVS